MDRGMPFRNLRVVFLALVFSMGVLALGWLKAQQYDKALYTQVNLVSSGYVNAQVTDPNLINPWGVSASATSPIWISNQATNTSTLYSITDVQAGMGSRFVVAIPTTSTSASQGPTGQVFTGGAGFPIPSSSGTVNSFFVFANLNGTISGWNPGSTGGLASAVIAVSNPGAVYTGLALATVPVPANSPTNAGNVVTYLYAADFTPPPDGGIKVFDSSFNAYSFGAGTFVDPELPSLPSDEVWAPFNVANLGGNLFVAYAPLPATGGFAIPGLHNGVIAEFSPTGTFMSNIAVSGLLDDPWGMAMAPSNFGRFSNDLLIGNFGDGKIVGFWQPSNGKWNYRGLVVGTNHYPLSLGALWSLWFGNGANGAATNTLYYTSGGPDQTKDGLLGAIVPVTP
jgi:uncharacterized protein (TIGR03118 family)